MIKDKIFIITFCTFFGFLACFTFFKTRTIKIAKEAIYDFTNFYLEEGLDGVTFEPLAKVSESTESEEEIEYSVKPNDTLEGIFNSFEFSNSDYRKVLALLNKHAKGFKLYANQKLILSYKTIVNYVPIMEEDEEVLMPSFEEKNQTNTFNSISFTNKDGVVSIFRSNEDFELKIIPFQKSKRVKFKTTTISSSLYEDGVKNGISPNVLENFIRLYSFDVDFQRDIRAGDKFEILYEEVYDENTNQKLADGSILFAKMDLTKSSNKNYTYYLFEGQYYDREGTASVKSFLKTPIQGARLSSGFGLRKHPILGFTKLHTGIDFAAPRGTPIFASASGTITFMGWNGTHNKGYGRQVVIKHNATYSTSYSHLNGFRKNLAQGYKVKQGEVIGYVGSTGYATGPHLHYEVIKNGHKINPKNVTSFSVDKLAKAKMSQFYSAIKAIDKQKDETSQ